MIKTILNNENRNDIGDLCIIVQDDCIYVGLNFLLGWTLGREFLFECDVESFDGVLAFKGRRVLILSSVLGSKEKT